MGSLVRSIYLRADATVALLTAPFAGPPAWKPVTKQAWATRQAFEPPARAMGAPRTQAHEIVGHALASKCVLGEGPVWDAGSATLYWLDIALQRLHAYRPVTARTCTARVPAATGAAAKCATGALLLATRRGIGPFDPGTARFKRVPATATQWPRNRYNDGKCDRAGRFWTGTLRLAGPASRERLFRFDPRGGLACMDEGFTACNGLGWSPDDRRFYLVDTFARCVFVYDFDLASGTIENRRVFAQWPDGPGVPDGLTVDADGCVWVANAGAGQLVRFDANGTIERTVSLPVPRPTSCTFGGPGLGTLFVTSSRLGLSRSDLAAAPLSGSLLMFDPGVAGLAEPAFAVEGAPWNP